MAPSIAPSIKNMRRILRRVSPSAIEVPISAVRSITVIIIVLEMLSTMITAMMKRMTPTCLLKRDTALTWKSASSIHSVNTRSWFAKRSRSMAQRRPGLLGVFQQQCPDVGALHFQQLPGDGERHPQGDVVVGFRHRRKKAPHSTFDRIDATFCRVGNEDHRIADVDAEVRGEAQAQDDAVRLIDRQVGALGDAQRTAQELLLVRLDRLGDKGDGFVADAHQAAERQALPENAHLRESRDGIQLGGIHRQQVAERVGRSLFEISLAGHLDVPELRRNGGFPMLEHDPVDEPVRDDQGGHAERDGRERERRAPSLSGDVASGQEDVGQQRVTSQCPSRSATNLTTAAVGEMPTSADRVVDDLRCAIAALGRGTRPQQNSAAGGRNVENPYNCREDPLVPASPRAVCSPCTAAY